MTSVHNEEDRSFLSSPKYDPLIHLNEIFVDPSSLSSLPSIQLHLSTHLHHLDTEIQRAAKARREQQSALQGRINELQQELEELFTAVENVKTKAEKADGVMGQLTGGIRRLDGGKQNLTTSMTALKRLQMLSIPIRLA
jgi:vacuolar protein sorting-associated protein 53